MSKRHVTKLKKWHYIYSILLQSGLEKHTTIILHTSQEKCLKMYFLSEIWLLYIWSKYNVMSSISWHVSSTFQNVFKTYLIYFFSRILKTFQSKTWPTKRFGQWILCIHLFRWQCLWNIWELWRYYSWVLYCLGKTNRKIWEGRVIKITYTDLPHDSNNWNWYEFIQNMKKGFWLKVALKNAVKKIPISN